MLVNYLCKSYRIKSHYMKCNTPVWFIANDNYLKNTYRFYTWIL